MCVFKPPAMPDPKPAPINTNEELKNNSDVGAIAKQADMRRKGAESTWLTKGKETGMLDSVPLKRAGATFVSKNLGGTPV